MENVIVLSVAGTEQAQEALRGLRRLDETNDVQLEAAAVVERRLDGQTIVVDAAEEFHLRATAAASLVGALIGALSGPPGVVIGGVTGAAVGSLVDVADAENADQVLRSLGQTIPAGSAATIAVLLEKVPGAVDALAAEVGGTVQRTPRADVEYEIAHAENAAITAARDAEGRRTVGERMRDIKDAVFDRR